MSAERMMPPELNPPESLPEEVTLHVGLLDKVEKPMEIKVSRTIFKRLTETLEERGIKPEFVAAGAVIFVAAATVGVVAKKTLESHRKKRTQKTNIPTLSNEQKEKFGELYQNSYSRIYSFISGKLQGVPVQEIEDLTQEVFFRAYRNFPPRFTFPDLPDPYLPWFFGIARNLVIDRYMDSLREKERMAGPINEEYLPKSMTIPDIGLIIVSQEESAELQRTVASLKSPYPLIIWLKVALQWSNAEIARMLGTTESAIKSTYFHAT
ncbi:MAG: RNA polymerase sigma factor, partial [candidate division Zixibacteria bacterium]|nr:RNA polymerase sigma factor [candidate division Zixibacteria bacterium]